MGIMDLFRSRKGFGYRPDPADPRDIAFKAPLHSVGLPESVDLRPYLGGGILNQGTTSSCVAHAFAYAIDVRETMAGLEANQPSRLFMYYYARSLDGQNGRDEGTYLRSCAKALQLLGTPEESLWPFKPNKVNKAPGIEAQFGAFPRRAGRYDRIAEVGMARKPVIMAANAAGHAVVFGTALEQSFLDPRGPEVALNLSGAPIVGYHAMCIIGYDARGALVVNSWGPKWRKNGCVWMPWEYIAHRETQDLWVIHGWKRIQLSAGEVTHAG